MSLFRDFVYWEQQDRDTIKVKRTYIDLAGDVIAGLLLSQIIYWHLPDKRTGKTRLRVNREGKLWLAKSRTDWWDECRISPRQFDRASKILEDKGIIQTAKFKFNGSPTIHISLNFDKVGQAIAEDIRKCKMDFNESVNSISPTGENHIDESVNSLTETTAKNTTNLNADFETLWSLYPRKKGKAAALKKYPKLLKEYTHEQLIHSVKAYIKEIQEKGIQEQYIQYGSTFFNGGFVDYLDKPVDKPKRKSVEIAIPPGLTKEERMEFLAQYKKEHPEEFEE